MGLRTRLRAQRSRKGTHTLGHHVTSHAWVVAVAVGVCSLRSLSQVASGQLSRVCRLAMGPPSDTVGCDVAAPAVGRRLTHFKVLRHAGTENNSVVQRMRRRSITDDRP